MIHNEIIVIYLHIKNNQSKIKKIKIKKIRDFKQFCLRPISSLGIFLRIGVK